MIARALAILLFATCALAQGPEDAQRLYRDGKIEEAADAMARAASRAGDAKERAELESAAASWLGIVGRADEAEAHWREAARLLEGAVPALDRSLAAARVMLAGLEAEHGRLDEAALHACTALEAAEGAPDLETVCLATLARVSFGRRQYGEAMALLKLAIARSREAEPEPGSLSFGLGRAVAAFALGIGRVDVAERMLAEIQQMVEKARPNPSDALEFARLGVEFLTMRGRLDEAERGGQEALLVNAKVAAGIPIPVAALTVALARVAIEQGDLERAASRLEQAEPALRREGFDTRRELCAFLAARAELRRRQEDRAAARSDLEEALRLESRDGEHGLGAARALLTLARVESEEGAHARAMDCAARATRIFLRELGYAVPECREACDTYGLLRTRAIEAGLLDVPPLRGMRVGEALEPDATATDAKVKEMLGKAAVLDKKGDAASVLALADEALALRPGEPVAHWARCRALQALRRNEEALAAADAAISWSSDPSLMYRFRAGLDVVLRHHDRAIVDATYAILLGDKDPAVRRLRGIARLGRGEAELGLRNLDAALAAGSTEPTTQHFRGFALWSLERFDEAAEAFRLSSAAGRLRATACEKLARYERMQGNEAQALAQAAASIDADAEFAEAYGVRGFIRLDRGEWKAALGDFEAWAGDEPPSLYGRILQWICRARLGERAAADAALRAAIDAEKEREDLKAVAMAILGDGPLPPPDPPSPTDRAARARQCEAYFLLGAWREVEGDPAGAKALYERSVAMESPACLEFQSAKAALARLAAGR